MMKKAVCLLLCALLLTCSAALSEEAFSPVGTWIAVSVVMPEGTIDLVAYEQTFTVVFREDMTVSIADNETTWRYSEAGEIIVNGSTSDKDRIYTPSVFTTADSEEIPSLCIINEDKSGEKSILHFVREGAVDLPESAIRQKYYTGLTESFYTGTWELSELSLQGKVNRNPATQGISMTIRLDDGKGLWVSDQNGNRGVTLISGTAVEQDVPEEGFSVSMLRFQMQNGRYAYLIPLTDGTLSLALSDTTVFLFEPVSGD